VTGNDFEWNAAAGDDSGEQGLASVPGTSEDVAQMSFEVALAELEGIVQELERGELELDAAISAYERGTRLRLHCEQKLKEARLRVERITLGEDGRPRSEPVEPA
jgi:exodeoxyribonuclease VII small subunit